MSFLDVTERFEDRCDEQQEIHETMSLLDLVNGRGHIEMPRQCGKTHAICMALAAWLLARPDAPAVLITFQVARTRDLVQTLLEHLGAEGLEAEVVDASANVDYAGKVVFADEVPLPAGASGVRVFTPRENEQFE